MKELWSWIVSASPMALLDRWRDTCRTSARYEYLFWQMSWEEQTWPI